MIPIHLSSNTPSTSNPNGIKKEIEARTTLGISSEKTVRYMYPIPMIGTVPVRIRMRPPLDDGIRIEPLTIGPRSVDYHRLPSRATTVAARNRRPPLRAPIFDIIEHTPNRHEPTYEESSQFNPAQLDTVSISARRNSQSRASQAHSTNVPRSMVLYDQQPQSMIPGGYVAPYDAVPVPAPVPMWTYPIPPPPPPQLFAYFPPSPLDAKTMRKIMKKAAEDEKRYQTKYQPSSCSKFCCGGAAPLFWILLILILLFFIAVLIVALIYV